jgi:hypothetical protein
VVDAELPEHCELQCVPGLEYGILFAVSQLVSAACEVKDEAVALDDNTHTWSIAVPVLLHVWETYVVPTPPEAHVMFVEDATTTVVPTAMVFPVAAYAHGEVDALSHVTLQSAGVAVRALATARRASRIRYFSPSKLKRQKLSLRLLESQFAIR